MAGSAVRSTLTTIELVSETGHKKRTALFLTLALCAASALLYGTMSLPFEKLFQKIADEAMESVSQGLLQVQRENWNYQKTAPEGPERWWHYYSTCSGQQQSPINILTRHVYRDGNPQPIELTGSYQDDLMACGLRFNIYDQKEVIIDNFTQSYKLAGTSFQSQEEYYLLKIALHFGDSEKHGSEHKINGHSYPFEIQLVHRLTWKPTYGKKGKLLTLAIFGELSDQDNPALEPIVKQITDFVSMQSNFGKSMCLNFSDLLPGNGIQSLYRYYRYLGSETVPPCTERVTWNILKDKIAISKSQLVNFRKLYLDFPLLRDNYRPIQGTSKTRTCLDSYGFYAHRNFTDPHVIRMVQQQKQRISNSAFFNADVSFYLWFAFILQFIVV